MPEPHLRAGDTDRAAVATVLGRHMADGRLTVAEYDERVARAYAARTYGELDELTADLPSVDSGRSVAPRPQRPPGARARLRPHGRPAPRHPRAAWACVAAHRDHRPEPSGRSAPSPPRSSSTSGRSGSSARGVRCCSRRPSGAPAAGRGRGSSLTRPVERTMASTRVIRMLVTLGGQGGS